MEKILSLLRQVKRPGMDKLIEWLLTTDFFTAPASTMFHGNWEGQLAEHGFSVYTVLDFINTNLLNHLLPKDTVIICGNLHDVNKIGLYKKVLKENPPPAGPNWVYERDDTLPLGHSEKSIMILQKFIELTDMELILIRWHMGAYDPALQMNDKALKKYFPYFKLLYFADDISTSLLEKTREK